MVRISSGYLKGKKIEFPSHWENFLRPTQGIVKKGLFSKIQNHLSGAKFLDLFAGSGSVGFEAFSNGAREIFWVEKNIKLIQFIKEQAKRLNVCGEIFGGDYKKILKFFIRKKIQFDLIYVDPPYQIFSDSAIYENFLRTIFFEKIISEQGILVFERSAKLNFPIDFIETVPEMKYESRSYGDTVLDFYQSLNSLDFMER